MNKEKLNELALQAGFEQRRGILLVAHSNGSWVQVDERLQAFKNLLLEHFIQSAEKLKQKTNGELTSEMLQATNSFNGGITEVIKMIEGMK